VQPLAEKKKSGNDGVESSIHLQPDISFNLFDFLGSRRFFINRTAHLFVHESIF